MRLCLCCDQDILVTHTCWVPKGCEAPICAVEFSQVREVTGSENLKSQDLKCHGCVEKTRPCNRAGKEKEDFLETITGGRLKEETRLAQQWGVKVQDTAGWGHFPQTKSLNKNQVMDLVTSQAPSSILTQILQFALDTFPPTPPNHPGPLVC